MPELWLYRAESTLEVTFGEHHVTVPWMDVAPDATTGQRIYDDAVAYEKNLFAKTFADEPLRLEPPPRNGTNGACCSSK